jgi:hypothetical protein
VVEAVTRIEKHRGLSEPAYAKEVSTAIAEGNLSMHIQVANNDSQSLM